MSNEDTVMTDPASCMAQGRRSYLLNDYSAAVTFFGQACLLLSEKHGEVAPELADPYLNYGRALLNLNREEQGVLGPNVPGTEEAEEEEVEEDGNEQQDEQKTDEKVETSDDKVEASADKVEASAEKVEASADKVEANADKAEASADKAEASSDKAETSDDKVETSDEKMETSEEKVETSEEKVETSDDKTTNGEKSKEEQEDTDAKPEAATDTTESKENGEASHSEQNGEGHESDDDEDDEDNKSNLQLAWEVLELSKVIYTKIPDSTSKLAEIHRLLGEVAMESNNLEDAAKDLETSLELYKSITPKDSRCIADVLYQLGLTSSLQNDFEKAIERFTESSDLIKGSIHDLQQDPPVIFDSSINVEQELKELKELLPEIEAKIADMREMDQNTAKAVLENVKKYMSGETTNGAGPSGAGSSGSSSASTSTAQKEVKDISHLVRKSKRKNEDEVSELATPCKKPVITPSENSA